MGELLGSWTTDKMAKFSGEGDCAEPPSPQSSSKELTHAGVDIQLLVDVRFLNKRM